MSDTTFPLVMTTSGPVPTPPATILSTLTSNVAQTNPDYTANLPGSLIDDISGTDVGALVLMDQARVEIINSITPFGGNAFLLNQLGLVYGIPQGQATNTSVYVVFSTSPPTPSGLIAQGFLVSDGTYQYQVVDGGITESDGSTAPLLAIATQTGSWAVAQNTVVNFVTSAPPISGVTWTVTNPNAGSPGSPAQTLESYRASVL